MDQTIVRYKNPRAAMIRSIKLFIPALILFAALTGFQLGRARYAAQPALQANGLPINPAIEEKFGVRFTGLHVAARSGLVDLRYRVIDAGKAKNFGHYTETSPLLIDEETGGPVEVTIMGLHNHRVETGRIYYILFRNTANVLHKGSKVTIQIGDARLEHFPVQ